MKRINEQNLVSEVILHFEKNKKEGVKIESQTSSDERIYNALAGASKTHKGGQGRPEHIITFNRFFKLIIITEVKGDSSLHESSKSEINTQKYAVDGVKHYSQALSKEFDVISIAISGDSLKNSKITHFYQPKNSSHPQQILGDKLLDFESYINFYTKNDLIISQDYEKLRNYASELNTKLHSNKIIESHRSLLLSSILMSLESKNFVDTYEYMSDPKQLANFLYSTTCNVFEQTNNLNQPQINLLKSQFAFITTDTTLNTKQNVLKNLIYDINKNVKSFIDTYKYRDILGEIYNVFLSYSNSDKGLGVVLTPPHITEFCCEIAQVNSDSVVLDTCTGTSGFLISAMKYMINDCKGDLEKIKNVKTNQLIGVEYQSHIYALAISNFMIHKSTPKNILSGSCFSESNILEVKKTKPTIGFLNPPYKADKKNDVEELDFVLNNLECLSYGSTCVALLPMSCAVRSDKKILHIRETILKYHTLEGVLSMPDELFHNSNAGVVSCLMIFTAHKPHNFKKQVYFGYYKDDGFVKRKNLGRVDYFNKWENIKEKWVNNFLNKKSENGFSTTFKIEKNSEWSVEKYLTTDYNKLEKEDFEKELHNYSTYLFSNSINESVSSESQTFDQLKLTDTLWKEFLITDIFDVKGSKTTKPDVINSTPQGEYPYVTTQATNNGVEKYTNIYTEEGNVLTIDSAVLGYVTYQPKNFSASDHVEKLIPKSNLDVYSMFFLKTILNKEQYRFNYGRKASQSRIKELHIYVPVDELGELNLNFMVNYIKSCKFSKNL